VSEPVAAGHPAAIELYARDGNPIRVRPILPQDKGRLLDAFHRLSLESRIRRFMSPVAELSQEQLRYLTEIDYRDHMAWVALDPTQPDMPGIGVARYVRLPSEPAVAEAAVTVVDEHQGRGVGTILMGMLTLSAQQMGITTLRAYVLEENRPMLEILRGLGATVSHEEAGVLRVDAPVLADPEDIPDTPTGRVFKAVARRVIPPFALRPSWLP
jgi:RimJ/RimL family protein N-acetyltransferase